MWIMVVVAIIVFPYFAWRWRSYRRSRHKEDIDRFEIVEPELLNRRKHRMEMGISDPELIEINGPTHPFERDYK